MSDENLLICYNKGCGKRFDPANNTSESCVYHCGAPVFHDAYKGWSCCNRKCIDFTEFLNIKGCSKSFHSNVKPPEPEKPRPDEDLNDVIEFTPKVPIKMERPSFDTPLIPMKRNVMPSLVKQLESLTCNKKLEVVEPSEIPIGTTCKNSACKEIYQGHQSSTTPCVHHPGVPIFHEGLKYWSCCTKRTTDFEVFLSQIGCKTGNHVWFKKTESSDVKCRTDWYQTGSHVVYTVFGKKCLPDNSTIEISPIRLKFSFCFPELGGSFSKDLELRGIIDTEKSVATFGASNIEIKLKKAELGSWNDFDFPRKEDISETEDNNEEVPPVESVDLSII